MEATERKRRVQGAQQERKRIAVSVGDDGVADLSDGVQEVDNLGRTGDLDTRSVNAASMGGHGDSSKNQQAIEDVTKLIREKLKNLKSL